MDAELAPKEAKQGQAEINEHHTHSTPTISRKNRKIIKLTENTILNDTKDATHPMLTQRRTKHTKRTGTLDVHSKTHKLQNNKKKRATHLIRSEAL